MPRRCYTLTHNDITGALSLTVDTDYNYRQISGFYTKLLRDEVIAEWRFDTPDPSLHVYCYVSGTERWLAPAPLRNYIFRREIPLVGSGKFEFESLRFCRCSGQGRELILACTCGACTCKERLDGRDHV